jgi:hypothetical protein
MQLPAMKSLSVNADSNFDGVLVMLDSTCGGDPLQCEDGESFTRFNVPAGNYFLVIDGWGDDEFGQTTLTVSGVIRNGASCEAPLAQSGALTCAPGYACAGTPGSRTCRPSGCNDGLDNDGDGVADYPTDPGCSSPSDPDETDECPGPNCPACSDGQDNDGDGLIDYPEDPGCAAASEGTEACDLMTEPVIPIVLPSTPGTTVGTTNDMIPECGDTFGSQTAGDQAYSITVPDLTNLTVEVDAPDFEATLSMLDATCGGSALDCEEFPSTIEAGPVTAGTYYFVVDGYDTETGAFSLNVSGTIANGASCETPLVDTGALSCASGYACSGTAGSRTCEPAQCNDGIDNDGDGLIDYPNEPGCESREDNDETDPTTLPACANTTDDDGDGLIDYPADYGCAAAGATTEAFCTPEVDPTAVITMNPTTGDTSTLTSNFATSSCQPNASGPDTALALQLPVPVDELVLDLSNSSFDTVLTLRDTTCGTEVGCDDDSGDPDAQSKLTVDNVPAGNYAVVVDGWNGRSGTYTLTVTGTVAAGTSCTSPLFTAGILVCPTGTTCTGSPATCQ